MFSFPEDRLFSKIISGLSAKTIQHCDLRLNSPLLYPLRPLWRPGTPTPSWYQHYMKSAASCSHLFLDSSKKPIASEDCPSSREETRSSSEITERSRARNKLNASHCHNLCNYQKSPSPASAVRSSVNGTLLAIPLRAWKKNMSIFRKGKVGSALKNLF